MTDPSAIAYIVISYDIDDRVFDYQTNIKVRKIDEVILEAMRVFKDKEYSRKTFDDDLDTSLGIITIFVHLAAPVMYEIETNLSKNLTTKLLKEFLVEEKYASYENEKPILPAL